jgi:hypothetical protein
MRRARFLGVGLLTGLVLAATPAAAQLRLNEFQADGATFFATAEYPAKTVGLLLGSSAVAEGYVLLAPKHNTDTYLIDNAGRVVHSWSSAYVPGQSAYLLANGHLLRTCMITGPLGSGGGEGGRIEEYDWDGNLVWEFNYSTDQYMQHHDIKPLPNGNVLLLAVEKKTYQEVLAAGFNPALLDSQIATSGYMLPDTVVEIAPAGSSSGTVVWKWRVWDHLVQNYDPAKSNYGVPGNHPELVDPNGYAETGRIMQFWNHMNSIAYNPELDEVMLSVRGSSEVWVIDHGTTTAEAASHSGGARGRGGDLLYRWGNPVTYDAGTAADQTLLDQHDAQWIEPGYPGEGNILVFNNGLGRNYSSVDEFVLPMDASGNYLITPGQAYGPDALAWTYTAPNPYDLYSEAISGAQRQADGNTLICDGVHGVLTEVTSAGETVWKYVNPEINTGILYQGDVSPLDIRGHNYNAVFKVQRYAPDFAGFAGRDLSPVGPLELYRDWIEIRNTGASAVDMGGMYLTNDVIVPTKWRIPSGASVAAGGYLLFWADNQTASGDRHAGFTLDATGGSIALYATDGVTQTDAVTYGPQATDISYGRYPDGTGAWEYMTTPTPGSVNAPSSNQPPAITGTARTPVSPGAVESVWVTSTITDDGGVGSASLTYSTGTGTGTTTTVFTETMTAVAVKPWTGTGAVYPWTVTGTYFEQRTGSNYGTGNPCGMEYKSGATLNALTAAMMATTSAIDAAGASAYVEFYLQSLTLDGTDGWTFQLDSGSGYVTRLSELTGSSHGWQKYHYDLAAGELVSALRMRFQFTGGGAADDDRIDLDQITVTVTTGGTTSHTVTMYDDGAHADGTSGDHVYGGQIPAMATGTTVSYYVTATDGFGFATTDPPGAPSTVYSYTVGQAVPPPVADGKLAGTAARFTRNVIETGQIIVTYDATACAGEKAVIVYGSLGNFSTYQGCAQSDAGEAGTATIDASGLTNVWFNILWTNGTTAGHPGFGSSGTTDVERSWSAAGFCGIAADDHGRYTCP